MLPGNCRIFLVSDRNEFVEKTASIKDIRFDAIKKKYLITFYSSPNKIYTYSKEKVSILCDKQEEKESENQIYNYLKSIADFSEIKNELGESLLSKFFMNYNSVNEKSILMNYINPSRRPRKEFCINDPIFPFGCNNSQYRAVKTALSESISIIQGPPGTGKTQTILNIIANILICNKRVLVVSNNNSATKNIMEKLSSEKYGLDFLCAFLGKKENKEDFLGRQTGRYPSYLESWGCQNVNVIEHQQKLEKLKSFFYITEEISALRQELSDIETEIKHYNLTNKTDTSSQNLKNFTSENIMNIKQKIGYRFSDKRKISGFCKFILLLRYGLGTFKFWKTSDEDIMNMLEFAFYEAKKKELEAEIEKKLYFAESFDPQSVYDESLAILKNHIYKRYENKKERCILKKVSSQTDFAVLHREYPIILSTTFSSRNCMPFFNRDFLYDYLIVDEASQVDIVTGALACSCAKNVVIVGDKAQLPNVVDDYTARMTQEALHKFGLGDGYSFKNSFLESVEKVLTYVPQTMLREHYRCHPKIINFCNQKFYDNQLIVMTEDKGEKDVLNVLRTVPGNHCSDSYNQRQIDVIKEEILPDLKNTEPENIGIVTPYNNQENRLNQAFKDIDSSTVHKFQGREKDTIIISTVDNEITPFADNANLFNVAVSRAKKQLYIVISGNDQPENTNIMSLVSYIEYNNCVIKESGVRSVFDYLYKQYSDQKFHFLKDKKKISEYDSENIIFNVLEDIFKEKEFSHLSSIFEFPLKNILVSEKFCNLEDKVKKYALNIFTHIDFAVYRKLDKKLLGAIEVDGYSYHKEGSQQAERDRMKNHIFELHEIPYLRISTKSSGIQEKIKSWLREITK